MAKSYKIGYGKPPKHTQYKKGETGNPRGRPKGERNLKTDLSEELAERIMVREAGQSRHVSKQRAVVKSLVNKALKGDTRASVEILSMILRLLGDKPQDEPIATLNADDLDIFKVLEMRRRRQPFDVARGTGATARESDDAHPSLDNRPETSEDQSHE